MTGMTIPPLTPLPTSTIAPPTGAVIDRTPKATRKHKPLIVIIAILIG